jgi:hypothetical protein
MEQTTLSQLQAELDLKECWIAYEAATALGYPADASITMGVLLDLPSKENNAYDWQNNNNQLMYLELGGVPHYVLSHKVPETFQSEASTVWKVYDIFGNTKKHWQFK